MKYGSKERNTRPQAYKGQKEVNTYIYPRIRNQGDGRRKKDDSETIRIYRKRKKQLLDMTFPPLKWKFIDVHLEIDGVVVLTQVASHTTYKRIYEGMLFEAKYQRLPWAVFITRSEYKKPRIINSGISQDRDRYGRFTKVKYQSL